MCCGKKPGNRRVSRSGLKKKRPAAQNVKQITTLPITPPYDVPRPENKQG